MIFFQIFYIINDDLIIGVYKIKSHKLEYAYDKYKGKTEMDIFKKE